jgi:hypothetical protein
LRDECVEAEQQAESEQSDRRENVGAEGDRSNGDGAVGKMADHDGVHDAHGHPAKFGENERDGEFDGGAKLFAKIGEKGHRWKSDKIALEEKCRVQRVYAEWTGWGK